MEPLNESWFRNKLDIGPYPYLVDEVFNAYRYQYIINVSDEHYPKQYARIREAKCQYFWFPMSEHKYEMGLNSIYGALLILLQAEQENASVYLHCHAGSNRSVSVRQAFHLFRTGRNLQEPIGIGHYENKLMANCERGYLPSRKEFMSFIEEMRADLDERGMKPGILTLAKVNALGKLKV